MQQFSRGNAVSLDPKNLRALKKAAPELPEITNKLVPELLFPYNQVLAIEQIDETILKKIEQAICWQWPNNAICQHAGITPAVYKLLRKVPVLQERFEILEHRPEHIARRNICQEIEAGDLTTSKWFLERKTKDYAPKQQVDHTVTQIVDETAVLSTLEKLVQLSRQRAEEETARQADVIECKPAPIDDLLM